MVGRNMIFYIDLIATDFFYTDFVTGDLDKFAY